MMAGIIGTVPIEWGQNRGVVVREKEDAVASFQCMMDNVS